VGIGWPDRLTWRLRRALRRSASLSRSLEALVRRAALRWSRHYYDSFLQEVSPALVVTGSPGFHSLREIPLIREAQARRIPTLCVVFSWDNLQTHDFLPSRPDWLAVWNEAMVEEAMALHGYRREAIHIIGAPHFDLYRDPATFCSRESFCRALGLDPARRIVLVAACDNEIADNTFMLRLLKQARADGALPADAQILVRPHPMDPTRDFDPYRTDPAFVFDRRPRWSGSLRWNPGRDEMVQLANTLRHSDVVLSFMSTITIEAAILDRPIINVEFSTSQPELYQQRLVRHASPKHYRYILERDGMKRARNPEELLMAIRSYLEDAEQEREGRRRIAQDLTFQLDGRSSERLAELMIRLAAGTGG
jgi:CDP-glycerol glycerophosphotransferase (TagB/SpsB family)